MGVIDPRTGEMKKFVFSRNRPLTTAEIDELIMELLDACEEAAEELASAAIMARRSEADYRIAYAREFTLCGHKTGDMKTQHALNANRDLFKVRKDYEAMEVAAAELCRTRRAELEGLRTLAASARAAETGRG